MLAKLLQQQWGKLTMMTMMVKVKMMKIVTMNMVTKKMVTKKMVTTEDEESFAKGARTRYL